MSNDIMVIGKRGRSAVSETSGSSVRGPAPVGINTALLKILKNDRIELRNKLAGFTTAEPDKGSILSSGTHNPQARTTIVNRKSTRPDLQTQLRRTKAARPVVLLQNTYRLEPNKPFNTWIVRDIIKDALTYNLRLFTYESRAAAMMVKGLSEEIKFRVKLEKYDRCRIVCVVTITQRLHQTFRDVCRCLLDEERDQYANYVYDGNPTLYAVGTVFGIYYE